MATGTFLGDVSSSSAPKLESSPLAQEFESQIIQVRQANMNVMKPMGVTYKRIAGGSTHIPVAKGTSGMRKAAVGTSSQYVRMKGKEIPRVEIKWCPYYDEYFIRDGETSETALQLLGTYMADQMAAVNRLQVQVCIDALQERFMVGGSTTEPTRAASLAFAIDSRVKRNAEAFGGGKPV